MTRRALIAIALLASCKERGTISIPTVVPCGDAQPTQVAVYLKRLDACPTTCGLAGFSCEAPNCVAPCESGGYCTPDELNGLTIDPPTTGNFVLVMSYRYANATADQGLVCFQFQVDADGTTSRMPDPNPVNTCCIP